MPDYCRARVRRKRDRFIFYPSQSCFSGPLTLPRHRPTLPPGA